VPPLTTVDAVPLPLVPVLLGVTVLVTLLWVPRLVETGLWLVVEILGGLVYALWVTFKWTLIYSCVFAAWIVLGIHTLWTLRRGPY